MSPDTIAAFLMLTGSFLGLIFWCYRMQAQIDGLKKLITELVAQSFAGAVARKPHVNQ